MAVSECVNELMDLWRRENIPFRLPAGLAVLAKVERKLGVCFPLELRCFYEHCDGVSEEVVFQSSPVRHLRFWSVDECRLASDGELGPFGSGIVFCDYLLGSHEYACLLQENAPVVIVNGDDSYAVAPGFVSFLSGYLEDNPVIFGSRADGDTKR
jgi:hypothetical protein